MKKSFYLVAGSLMHGAPTFTAYAELMKGALGTVVICSMRSTFLPAITKAEWPEHIEPADIIKAAEEMNGTHRPSLAALAALADEAEEHHEASHEHPGALSNLPHDA